MARVIHTETCRTFDIRLTDVELRAILTALNKAAHSDDDFIRGHDYIGLLDALRRETI